MVPLPTKAENLQLHYTQKKCSKNMVPYAICRDGPEKKWRPH